MYIECYCDLLRTIFDNKYAYQYVKTQFGITNNVHDRIISYLLKVNLAFGIEERVFEK